MTSCRWLLPLCVLAAVGCDVPLSQHPLSDEKSSTIDELLIGQWEVVAPAEAAPEPGMAAMRFAIGRVAAEPRIVESVGLEFDADNVVQVKRLPLFATTIGELKVVSIPSGEPGVKALNYFVLRYDFTADGSELKFYLLNKDIVGPAIERGDLMGTTKRGEVDLRAPPQEAVKPKYREIRITAMPEELTGWIRRRNEAAFAAQPFVTLRRIEPQ